MGTDRKRSVVKTIRISRELNDYLVDEAEKSDTTVSALLQTILTSYKNSYSQFDKVKPVAMPPLTLEPLIEGISDEDLKEIGRLEASRLFAYTEHVFNQDNPQGRIDYCLLDLMPTSNWFTCQSSRGGFVISHQLGEKWTTYLLSFLSALVELDIGVKPDLQAFGNIIFMSKPSSIQSK